MTEGNFGKNARNSVHYYCGLNNLRVHNVSLLVFNTDYLKKSTSQQKVVVMH